MNRTELSHATSMADHHLDRARERLREVIDLFQADEHTHQTLEHDDSVEQFTVDEPADIPDEDALTDLDEDADPAGIDVDEDEVSANQQSLSGAARRQFAKAATENGLTNAEFATSLEHLIAVEKHLLKANRNIAELRSLVGAPDDNEEGLENALRAAEQNFDVDDLVALARLGIDEDTGVTPENSAQELPASSAPNEVAAEQKAVLEEYLSGVVTGDVPAVPEEVYETVVAAQGQLEKKHRRVREAVDGIRRE